jgi:tetratricopeptide (TPR) repeat protein
LIGNAHFRRKEHDKAMYAYEQALECTDGCEKPSDFDHIAAANGNLGTVCWSTGDMERSITCIRKVLDFRIESEISKGRDPCDSLSVATSYHQLGLALTLHRDYKKALNALFEALEIQQSVLGRKSIDVARTLDAIGKVYLLRGDADRSMHCHQEAYATKYELTGECGALVITSLTNIAAAHLARNEEKEAILAYLAIRNAQSFELHKISDPETSARVAMDAGETIQMLVDLYTKTGAYQNAKLAADEALELYQQSGISKGHPKMEALKQSVKIIYFKSL